MKRYTLPVIAVTCGLFALGLLAGRAVADTPAVVAEAADSLYRPLFVPVLVDAAPAVTTADPLTELAALKQAYEALKANADPSMKPLLWAGLIAVGLKVLLSLANAIWKKPKKWLAWTAIISAVPIAALAHYAGGHGLMASLIVAGGGPGAVLFNEVLKLITKPSEGKA